LHESSQSLSAEFSLRKERKKKREREHINESAVTELPPQSCPKAVIAR
jgi:hypothetical protein